ncbi:MAG: DUF308 domain-containing protein [Thermoplasmata archaeon]|nr:DUF308 domain-containing protein [Thermoplasmata archaeon]
MRALYIGLGLIALGLGITVLILPNLGISLLVVILVVGLLLNGVVSIVAGVGNKSLPGGARALGVITGVLALGLLALVLAIPGAELSVIVIFLAFGLLFWGISRIAIDGSNPNLPGGFKALGIVVGVLALILSFMVLADPLFGLGLAVAFLSIGLIFGGIAAIASGVAGVKMAMPAAAEPPAPPEEPAA